MKKKEHVSDLLLKLAESIALAKSAITAAEKWVEVIGDDLGVETSTLNTQLEKLSEAHKDRLVATEDSGKVIEGVFDGQNMIAPDETKYPVPANYASKSKLVEGDGLKLMIQPNGAFVYKQISPAPRKLLTGRLVIDGSQYQVLADGKTYNVLYASVTFFRAMVGDNVTVVVPVKEDAKWAAIENVIPDEEGEE